MEVVKTQRHSMHFAWTDRYAWTHVYAIFHTSYRLNIARSRQSQSHSTRPEPARYTITNVTRTQRPHNPKLRPRRSCQIPVIDVRYIGDTQV